MNAWKYVFESRKYIFAAAIIFLFSAIFGFLFSNYLSGLDDIIRELVENTADIRGISLVWFILQNNATSAFLALFLGIFLALAPIGNAIVNGAVVGYVLSKVFAATGSYLSFWKLLPHGVFELPAIFISIGLGMKLGFSFFSVYFGYHQKNMKMKQKLASSLAGLAVGALAFVMATQRITSGAGIYDFLSVFLFFFGFILMALGLVLMLILLFGNRALRVRQLREFSYRFNSSVAVFIYVVIPLLIVAAIIEGLLITYL